MVVLLIVVVNIKRMIIVLRLKLICMVLICGSVWLMNFRISVVNSNEIIVGVLIWIFSWKFVCVIIWILVIIDFWICVELIGIFIKEFNRVWMIWWCFLIVRKIVIMVILSSWENIGMFVFDEGLNMFVSCILFMCLISCFVNWILLKMRWILNFSSRLVRILLLNKGIKCSRFEFFSLVL